MPLPNFVAPTDIFFTWLDATNNLTSHVDNTSAYLLVAQNATPRTSTGNLALTGTFTVGTTVINTVAIVANGHFLTTINASALATGTVPLSRLDGNVILTTSTTGMNASALSTGIVPDARIAGAYTNITSLTIGTTVANATTVSATNLSGNGASITSVNAIVLGGKTEANLNVNSAAQATNATNLNGQPGSYYTNASNITTGTLPIEQLSGNVLLTTSTTGINASALSTGTVSVARLDSSVLLTTSTTGINASALSTGTVPDARIAGAYTNITSITMGTTVANTTTVSATNLIGNGASVTSVNAVALGGKTEANLNVNSASQATNATNLNSQPASFYTNASNITTGTLTIARLDGNVILTTSTTGINASAISTGTVSDSRLPVATQTANGIVTIGTQSFGGTKTFHNDVYVTGALYVQGNTVAVSANNLVVDDSLIQLAANNLTSDLLDIGLYGNYNADGGTHEHTGLFRDASDDTWKLFEGLQEAPTGTINISGAGYTTATLQAYLSSGGLLTNASATQLTANSTYAVTITANTISATTVTANLTGTASNATNLNSQPGSYYTNASNITTGTLPVAQLSGNVLLTTSTTGINASALSTGTVPDARIAGAYTNITSLSIGTTVANTTTVSATNLIGNGASITSVNAIALGGKTEANLNVNSASQATNATNLNSQPASFYTNASNITTGTLAIARLDGNVILTTSTTGINASALSTGTVPVARLDSSVLLTTSTTGINASALSTGTVPAGRLPSASTTANGAVDTTTQSFAGNKTFQNTVILQSALTANSQNGTAGQVLTSNGAGVYWATASAGATANSTGGTGSIQYYNGTTLGSSANLVFDGTNIFVGNTTANGNFGQVSLALANTTNTATLTPISLTIGSTVVNTTVVTATTKEFNIAHPTKSNARLRYGSLESPYHGVRLTGRAVITDATVEVPLPDYIHALCAEEGSQVQITNHGHDKILWVERIDIARNCFVVKMRRRWWDTTPYAFYWSFTAVRRDVVPLDVEGAP